MARLPIEGGDQGSWGKVLNDYLMQTHKDDGSLKDGIVTAAKLAPSSALQNLATTIGNAGDGSVLVVNSSSANGVSWQAPQVAASDTVVVAKKSNNTWPTRPTANTVVWVGVGSPDPSAANANDIWIDTTP